MVGFWNEYLPKFALVLLLPVPILAVLGLAETPGAMALAAVGFLAVGDRYLGNGSMDAYLALYAAAGPSILPTGWKAAAWSPCWRRRARLGWSGALTGGGSRLSRARVVGDYSAGLPAYCLAAHAQVDDPAGSPAIRRVFALATPAAPLVSPGRGSHLPVPCAGSPILISSGGFSTA